MGPAGVGACPRAVGDGLTDTPPGNDEQGSPGEEAWGPLRARRWGGAWLCPVLASAEGPRAALAPPERGPGPGRAPGYEEQLCLPEFRALEPNLRSPRGPHLRGLSGA